VKLLLGYLLLLSSLYGETMTTHKNLGKEFAKENVAKGLEMGGTLQIDDLLPEDDKGKTFDRDMAKQALSKKGNRDPAGSEASNYIMSNETAVSGMDNPYFDVDEMFIQASEEFAKADPADTISVDFADFRIETCTESALPFSTSILRRLELCQEEIPAIEREVKTCQGHKRTVKHYWKSDAEKEKESQQKRLAADPTILSYTVKITGGAAFSDYKVDSKWTHHNDVATCDKYEQKVETTQQASVVETESWVFEKPDDQTILSSPQCTFLNKECLDEAPKVINGQLISRPCWLEKLNFVCKHEKQRNCAFLKNNHCLLLEKKCLQNGPLGCSLWELTFKCPTSLIIRKASSPDQDIFGLGEEYWDMGYEPNNTFAEVTSTLYLFDAIKKELENAQSADASNIHLFKGKISMCAKNVADHMLYDCCFSYSGLSNDLKLSQCTAEEVALGEMRDKGLCHYIGSKEEKFLQMWKSRTEHLFCCFPTKLSRVLQEEARLQLGIDWGNADKPNCQGLTMDQIATLDFTRLDLSEAFDHLPDTKLLKEK
jgi:conjugal transfer mating pair stabilization protein TraN